MGWKAHAVVNLSSLFKLSERGLVETANNSQHIGWKFYSVLPTSSSPEARTGTTIPCVVE